MPTPNRARSKKKQTADEPQSAYGGFDAAEDRLLNRIIAVPDHADDSTLQWSKGEIGRKPRVLTLADLATGLWAVECNGNKGTSYGQLDRCFRDCRGVSCHNNKASAIFKWLMAHQLIAKVGNYSAGRRGNVYVIWVEGQPKPQPPTSPKRVPQNDKPLEGEWDEPW